MQLEERARRAHNMTIPLKQKVVEEDAIIIRNPRTEVYYHSSTRGRLPLVKKDGEYFYADGTQLRALRKYIVTINPDADI